MSEESVEVQLARFEEQLCSIQEGVNDLKAQLRDTGKVNSVTFVTREEFRPVKTIVYGLVGGILSAVLLAIVALVLRK